MPYPAKFSVGQKVNHAASSDTSFPAGLGVVASVTPWNDRDGYAYQVESDRTGKVLPVNFKESELVSLIAQPEKDTPPMTPTAREREIAYDLCNRIDTAGWGDTITEAIAVALHTHAADAVECERDERQRFKDWTHHYLDTHGVPHHPPGTHGEHGCRIGDRMDWLMVALDAQRQRAEAAEFMILKLHRIACTKKNCVLDGSSFHHKAFE